MTINLELEDGSSWRNPNALPEVEWELRYGHTTLEDRLLAAGVLAAYHALVTDPKGPKKLAMLRRAWKAERKRK